MESVEHPLLPPLVIPLFSVRTYLLSLSALIVLLAILRELCAPPHFRTIFRRRKWHLPPGPAGSPILGSFFEWRNARRTVPDFIEYVRIECRYHRQKIADERISSPR